MTSLDNNSFAALATFRQMYNDEHDIFHVISKFVENIIVENNVNRFSIIEMRDWLYKNYNFEIPDYVIKKSIKKYLNGAIELAKGIYTVNMKMIDKNTIGSQLRREHESNISINDILYSYIENECSISLSSGDKNEINDEFISFIMGDNRSGKWEQYISSFYIKYQDDNSIISSLNRIKEGAILYSALVYSPNINYRQAWNKDLSIFLELDILFYLAGYNGEVYKKYASDMISLVKEMNAKSHRGKIYLKYFEDTEKEIENFFNYAILILRGERSLNFDSVAMVNILRGCKDSADVIKEKTNFYNMLDRNNIEVQSRDDYYDDNNHEYNIESSDLIEKFNSYDNYEKYLRHINYSNILRQDCGSKYIKDCTCLILTEASLAFKLEREINDGNKHVINMEMLSNVLWFDLKKGFGEKDYPSNFNILLKAETVMSSLLTKSVSLKYDELLNKYKNDEIDEEDVETQIVNLKCEMKKPEDINTNNVSEVMSVINELDIKSLESKNLKYKSEKDRLELEFDDLRLDRDNKVHELNVEKNKNEALNKQLNKHSQRIQECKKIILNKSNKMINFVKTILVLFVVLFALVAIILSLFFDGSFIWLSCVFPFIYLVALLIYGIISENEFNPIKTYKRLIDNLKNLIIRKLCDRYHIDYFN